METAAEKHFFLVYLYIINKTLPKFGCPFRASTKLFFKVLDVQINKGRKAAISWPHITVMTSRIW